MQAHASIVYACRLLRSYGVDCLTPELVRQAKFGSASAREPLLQALHDLALCVSAGLPRGCGDGMRQLRAQLQQERLEGSGGVAPEGRLLLAHLLATWRCPPGLVARLCLSDCSSRACLLALAWLVGHARLFEAALQHLQLPRELLPLLPPFPEDTSHTADVQARHAAAAAAAQQHSQRVAQLLRAQLDATGDGAAWPAVQAAAHHLLSTYRAASLRLQLLTSLHEGREKLLHQIKQQQAQQAQQQQEQQQQQQQQQQGAKQQSPSGGPSRARQAAPQPSAFELHLLQDPCLLQQHQQALQQACTALQQQLTCIDAARTFFAWAASALHEERQQGTAATAGKGGSAADVLPLLRQLPPAGTPVAGKALRRVLGRLTQAAAAAGISSAGGGAPAAEAQTAGAAAELLAALSLHGSPQRRAAAPPAAAAAAAAASQQAGAVPCFLGAAAAALVRSGTPPAAQPALDALPPDVAQQLQQQQQQQEQQQRQAAADEQQRAAHHQRSWCRRRVAPEQLAVPPAAGCAAPAAQAVVPVAAELQRLHGLALHVAQLLAKTRAGNRRELAAAAAALRLADAGTDTDQDGGSVGPQLLVFSGRGKAPKA